MVAKYVFGRFWWQILVADFGGRFGWQIWLATVILCHTRLHSRILYNIHSSTSFMSNQRQNGYHRRERVYTAAASRQSSSSQQQSSKKMSQPF